MATAPVLERPPLRRQWVDELTDAVIARLRGTGRVRLIRLRRKGERISALYQVGERDTAHVDYTPSAGDVDLHRQIDIEVFPTDSGLPALHTLVREPAAVLADATVEVVRYKPGSRCVLRLSRGAEVRYVKVYKNASQAQAAWRIAQLLDNQPGVGQHIPRPTALLPDLAAVVTEAVDGTSGASVLRPPRSVSGSALRGASVPHEQLEAAGAALAALHAVELPPGEWIATDQTRERNAARAAELITLHPATAQRAAEVSARVSAELDALQELAHATRPAAVLGHGAFKPSQLLFARANAVITDFDGIDRAEPARDLGYFLGYLRPPQMLRRVDGAVAWYESAAASFRLGYAEAALAAGNGVHEVSTAFVRTGPYQAVALIKRAVRRLHRMNAARLDEIVAVLDQIDDVLGSAAVLEPVPAVVTRPGGQR